MRFTSLIPLLFLTLVSFSPLVSAKDLPDEGTLKQYRNIEESLAQTKQYLSQAEQIELLRRVSQHPVTNLDNLSYYDPKGYIGFCFGRATGAHLMGRQLGLARDSIRKLFVIGDLRQGPDPEWRFHVTTLVRGANGQWWAIDPIMTWPISTGRPITVSQWIAVVQKVWDRKHRAKFYITDSGTIFPDITKDPDGTTGENIIELVFTPEGRDGFEKKNYDGYPVYHMNPDAQERQMVTVDEKDRFRFDGITLGSEFISYRGYYSDLLRQLSGGVSIQSLAEARMTPIKRGSFRLVSPEGRVNLGSIRLNQITNEKEKD